MSRIPLKHLRTTLRGPEFTTDLLQMLKCVIAASAAWWFAGDVLGSAIPFLAPWTALLTVHATVYRSFSRGAQTTVASGIGVLLSFLIGSYLGVSLWTFALALLVGMIGSRLSWLRDEGVAIATTGIFVLGSGFGEQAPLLLDRLVEVAVGVAFGVVVNLLIVPPLRDQQASRTVDDLNRRMGSLLVDMADEVSDSWDTARAEAWLATLAGMEAELESGWQTVRFARESSWGNPRRHLPSTLRARRRAEADGARVRQASYEEIMSRVDEGVSHLRHLCRTLFEVSGSDGAWDTRFRERWTAIVRDAGRAIADPDAEVEPVRDRLDELARAMAEEDGLPSAEWPIYGSLITSTRHIAVVVDDVASAREARESGRENPAG